MNVEVVAVGTELDQIVPGVEQIGAVGGRRHRRLERVAEGRALGGRPGTATARMTGLDSAGVLFGATTESGVVAVHVPWASVPTERREIRTEVVRMYHEACAALGIEPRQEDAPSGRPAH